MFIYIINTCCNIDYFSRFEEHVLFTDYLTSDCLVEMTTYVQPVVIYHCTAVTMSD